MLLKLLLNLAAGKEKNESPKRPAKKSKSELSREKDRREYDLWVMAEEYKED